MYYTVFDATIASFATLSSEIDLSKGWKRVFVMVPATTSNTAACIQAAEVSSANGGTYRRVVQYNPASAVASVDFTIGSAATNRIVECPPVSGLRYIKVETTAIVSFSPGYKILVSDEV